MSLWRSVSTFIRQMQITISIEAIMVMNTFAHISPGVSKGALLG